MPVPAPGAMLRIQYQSRPLMPSIPDAFWLAGPSPIASTPAPSGASSQSSGSPVATGVQVIPYPVEPESRPNAMPSFCGAPLGQQSPTAV
jgi:hypothetical protein